MPGDYRTETVSWQRVARPDSGKLLRGRNDREAAGEKLHETRTILVAQIGEIQDQDLRVALERQRDARRQGLKMAMFIMSDQNDIFTHAVWVPLRTVEL